MQEKKKLITPFEIKKRKYKHVIKGKANFSPNPKAWTIITDKLDYIIHKQNLFINSSTPSFFHPGLGESQFSDSRRKWAVSNPSGPL